ncbi:MAG: hypothetical protein DI582_08980 [Azospirillum brasilense]|nr:MAG: hypothetical protein DI582_08980 [Azospirillum brasilense]
MTEPQRPAARPSAPNAPDTGVLPPEQRGTIFVLNPDPGEWRLTNTRTGAEVDLERFRPRRPTVTLDPGHGYLKPVRTQTGVAQVPDHGASRTNDQGETIATESRLTQQFAWRTARALTDRGYDVILTRGDNNFSRALDGFVPRSDAAIYSHGPLISLHIDAAPPAASGPFVIVDKRSHRNSESHRLRATIDHANPGDSMNGSNGHRTMELKILSPAVVGNSQASIMIEIGNMANDRDLRNLQSATYQGQFARELARDIDRYMEGKAERNTEFDRILGERRDASPRGPVRYTQCEVRGLMESTFGMDLSPKPTKRESGSFYMPGISSPILDAIDPPVTPRDPCRPNGRGGRGH